MCSRELTCGFELQLLAISCQLSDIKISHPVLLLYETSNSRPDINLIVSATPRHGSRLSARLATSTAPRSIEAPRWIGVAYLSHQ